MFLYFIGSRVRRNIQKTKTAVSEFGWVPLKIKTQILGVQLGWVWVEFKKKNSKNHGKKKNSTRHLRQICLFLFHPLLSQWTSTHSP
jgi:hypothetical protein